MKKSNFNKVMAGFITLTATLLACIAHKTILISLSRHTLELLGFTFILMFTSGILYKVFYKSEKTFRWGKEPEKNNDEPARK